MNCGVLTEDLAVVGCSDSSVRLWKKSGGKFNLKSNDERQSAVGSPSSLDPRPDISRVQLAGDYIDDENTEDVKENGSR